MRYTYDCPCHGETVRFVPVDDRDVQRCHCGLPLQRRVIDGVTIAIPARFGTDMAEINRPLEGHEDTSVPHQGRWV